MCLHFTNNGGYYKQITRYLFDHLHIMCYLQGAVLIDVKALHAFLIAQTRLDVDHTISPAQYQQAQKEVCVCVRARVRARVRECVSA